MSAAGRAGRGRVAARRARGHKRQARATPHPLRTGDRRPGRCRDRERGDRDDELGRRVRGQVAECGRDPATIFAADKVARLRLMASTGKAPPRQADHYLKNWSCSRPCIRTLPTWMSCAMSWRSSATRPRASRTSSGWSTRQTERRSRSGRSCCRTPAVSRSRREAQPVIMQTLLPRGAAATQPRGPAGPDRDPRRPPRRARGDRPAHGRARARRGSCATLTGATRPRWWSWSWTAGRAVALGLRS